MDRRQRIFLYGVILGLIVFGFIFMMMTAKMGQPHSGLEGRTF